MTTVVASPPSFQSHPRIGWHGGDSSSNGLSTDDVSRMFMSQRKVVQRTNSSSSVSSTSSNSSTATAIPSTLTTNTQMNGENGSYAARKKPRGGFWPTAKNEVVTNGSGTKPDVTTSAAPQNPSTMSNSPVVTSPHQPQSQTNSVRSNGIQATNESSAVLVLLPLNGTFERKHISVPFLPDILRVGRQTNAKTVPTPSNGFFDSKVLSRQHAEVWADRNGKIWIRDVKSSNGTFVNGHRLSPENRESEPQELHQHDTLELGIDIISEDQKVVVHHKVSAKVEYVGIPGSSTNVLDLSFGDLDPLQSGALLSSPLSQPMVTSRSRNGATLSNGKLLTSSSVAGSQMNSIAQQRHLNLWSMPLNVEHLVKTLSNEMKAAKLQAQDLEQSGTFLTSLIPTDSREEKPPSPPLEIGCSRVANGRSRGPRVESLSRFSDPPAPPPQQPLPEKPDIARSSPTDLHSNSLLKRSDTAKVPVGYANSPVTSQSTHILSLVHTLESTKQELDVQAARVKELENMLKQERLAREEAEERARRFEKTASFRPIADKENVDPDPDAAEHRNSSVAMRPWAETNGSALSVSATSQVYEQGLQAKLDLMVAKMAEMKQDLGQFQQRAESAERDASNTRASLAEMVTRLRKESAVTAAKVESGLNKALVPTASYDSSTSDLVEDTASTSTASAMQGSRVVNERGRAPSRLPEQLERALATVMRDSASNGEMFAQTAPYASMLGVVLLGVGLMAYLNSWQKAER